jgi:DNA-directed RNA polymerase specialized sigma24 family protein
VPQKRAEELLQAGYRCALSLCCKPEDARELVHDAWIRLNTQRVPLINKPRLFRTVRNIFIDRYRSEQLLILESIDEHIEELSEVAIAIDRQIDPVRGKPRPSGRGRIARTA